MGNHGIPDIFYFQTPKRAHVLQTGRKQMVHIFVYQWEVQAWSQVRQICVIQAPSKVVKFDSSKL